MNFKSLKLVEWGNIILGMAVLKSSRLDFSCFGFGKVNGSAMNKCLSF